MRAQMVVEHLWTLHGCEAAPPSQEEVLLEDQRVVRLTGKPAALQQQPLLSRSSL